MATASLRQHAEQVLKDHSALPVTMPWYLLGGLLGVGAALCNNKTYHIYIKH